MTWHDHAACRHMPKDVFYPSEKDDRDLRQHAVAVYAAARQICMRCPVRVACLDWALDNDETRYGMYGGLSPTQRQALLAADPARAEHAHQMRDRRRRDKNLTRAQQPHEAHR